MTRLFQSFIQEKTHIFMLIQLNFSLFFSFLSCISSILIAIESHLHRYIYKFSPSSCNIWIMSRLATIFPFKNIFHEQKKIVSPQYYNDKIIILSYMMMNISRAYGIYNNSFVMLIRIQSSRNILVCISSFFVLKCNNNKNKWW